MTRAINSSDQDLAFEAAATRILLELRLMRLLGDAADRAFERYGATHITIDRTKSQDSAEVRAMIGDIVEIDLWNLDPLLWDEANDAGMQFVPAGQTSTIYPASRD
jgi:hypothetical protein